MAVRQEGKVSSLLGTDPSNFYYTQKICIWGILLKAHHVTNCCNRPITERIILGGVRIWIISQWSKQYFTNEQRELYCFQRLLVDGNALQASSEISWSKKAFWSTESKIQIFTSTSNHEKVGDVFINLLISEDVDYVVLDEFYEWCSFQLNSNSVLLWRLVNQKNVVFL